MLAFLFLSVALAAPSQSMHLKYDLVNLNACPMIELPSCEVLEEFWRCDPVSSNPCRDPHRTCCQSPCGSSVNVCLNKCSPLACDLNCEDGFMRDELGCEICRCSDATNRKRGMLSLHFPDNAWFKISDAACPQLDCDCDYGHVTVHGCPTCDCKPNPCESVQCMSDQKCQAVVRTPCDDSTCDWVAQCGDPLNTGCPEVDCDCDYGHLMVNDCPTCACLPDPCENVPCPSNHRCEAVKNEPCNGNQCNWVALCVKEEEALGLGAEAFPFKRSNPHA